MASLSHRVFLLLLAGCAVPALHAQREKLPPDDVELVERTWPGAKKTSTGIRYVIQAEGKGDTPRPGDMVSIVYVGRLLDGSIVFHDLDREHPFSFRVGRELVVPGWDQTVLQMKRGERRLVVIPPELAYGMRGLAPRVPRNATLVFEIELLDFKHDE
jgi:FKBP-type peptidyl-prolyl cis-trans isomerase